mgnify:CR=1 FL=1
MIEDIVFLIRFIGGYALFFTLFFLMQVKLNKTWHGIAAVMLIALPIASVAINEAHTPYFVEYSDRQRNAVEIVDYINGRLFVDSYEEYGTYADIFKDENAIFGKAFYAFAAVNGKYGAGGWNEQFVSSDYNKLVNSRLVTRGCDGMKRDLNTLNATEVLVFDDECDIVKNCGFEEKKRIGDACLYEIDSSRN